jgi:hypothetical protein
MSPKALKVISCSRRARVRAAVRRKTELPFNAFGSQIFRVFIPSTSPAMPHQHADAVPF